MFSSAWDSALTDVQSTQAPKANKLQTTLDDTPDPLGDILVHRKRETSELGFGDGGGVIGREGVVCMVLSVCKAKGRGRG